MKQFKIKIKNEEHSERVQDELYRLGYNWACNFKDKKYLHTKIEYIATTDCGFIKIVVFEERYKRFKGTEVVLQQLKEEKSIVEEFNEKLMNSAILLDGDKNSKNVYFKGSVVVELDCYSIDIHIQCRQKLS